MTTDNIGIMAREKRRERILAALGATAEPQSAGALGDRFGVSRQVIVQDIAVLRAEGAPIVSTNRGYILASGRQASRVFKVFHGEDRLKEEMELVVDRGGAVKNVIVSHRIYGRIEAELNISNRVEVSEFLRSIQGGTSRPLMVVTGGYHYHTVTAASENDLDEIETALRKSGFLVDK